MARNLTAHILPILDGVRTATTQKELPFPEHLMKLALTLNKHVSQNKASAQDVQPHSHAFLRRAEFSNSTIATEAQEGAAVIFGGATIAIYLTFILDAGEETSYCTLFKSDLKDVRYHARASVEGDGATVRHLQLLLPTEYRRCLPVSTGFYIFNGSRAAPVSVSR